MILWKLLVIRGNLGNLSMGVEQIMNFCHLMMVFLMHMWLICRFSWSIILKICYQKHLGCLNLALLRVLLYGVIAICPNNSHLSTLLWKNTEHKPKQTPIRLKNLTLISIKIKVPNLKKCSLKLASPESKCGSNQWISTTVTATSS